MHDGSSSPDPLNDTYLSPNLNHQLEPKHTPSKSSRKKRKIFQLDVGNEISPQKIRVTVEAGKIGDNRVKRISCSPSRSTPRQRQNATAEKVKAINTSEPSSHRGLNATPKRGVRRPRKSLSASSIKKNTGRSKNKSSSGLSIDSTELDLNSHSASQTTLGAQSARKESEKLRSSSKKLKRIPQAELLPANIPECYSPALELDDESEIERSKYIYQQGFGTHHNENSDMSPTRADIVPEEVSKIENSIDIQPKYYDYSSDKTNASNDLQNDLRRFARPSSLKRSYHLSKSKSGDANYPSPESLENQISPASRQISARASKAHSDQDIILNVGHHDDENWMTHKKITENQEPGFIARSKEYITNPGDTMDLFKIYPRNSSTHIISHPKLKIPITQVYNRSKPITSAQEAIVARINDGIDSDLHILSPKTADNPYEKDFEEEEDFDLLLETLNSPSSIRSKYQEIYEETERRSRRSKSPGFSDAYHKKQVQKINPGLAFSSTKILNPKVDDHNNEYTSELVATIEQEEVSDLTGGEQHICQIPQKLNFHPNTRKKHDSELSFLSKDSSCKNSLGTSQNSLQPTLKQLTTNDSILGIDSHQNETDFSSITSGYNELSPKAQKAELNPRSENLSSPQIPSSSVSDYSLYPVNSSTNLTNTSPKIYDSSNSNKLPQLSHVTKTAPSPQKISCDKQKLNPVDHVLAWTKSLDNSLKTSPHNGASEKTPPSSPTKSCLRSPHKTPTCLGLSDTPVKAVTFVSPSPSPPIYDSLSSSIWTKRHWSLLDEIVQCWKPENLAGRNKYREQNIGRNSTRVISQLLGKYVFSAEGERMKLEQWHLEAVDEFRGLIPGWEEKIIAMRVFSLLLGERIRAEEIIS